MKKFSLGVGALIVVIAAAIALAVTVKRNPGAQSNSRLSVREKAREKGHYTGTIRPAETTRYEDVESLARASTLIVTGLVQQQRSFVPEENNRMIVTGQQVIVQQVLKGTVRAGDTISVKTLGGKVHFEDGSTAELKTPSILKDPQLGKSYVFFLRPHKSDYRLVGGPQGLFEITGLGQIKAQVPANDKLARKYDNQTLDQLASVIRATLGQP